MQLLGGMAGRLAWMSRKYFERIRFLGSAGFRIEPGSDRTQVIAPRLAQRFEGIAFSPSGDTIAIAASEGNALFLFRRKADGRFEEQPSTTISGPASKLNYPHDVSFAYSGDAELLAVAQRTGSICIYERSPGADDFASTPVWEIRGPETNLEFSDAVAFVPPENHYLAACNLVSSKLTFYRRLPGPSIRFASQPVFELQHRSIDQPDGLAFSSDGQWLAIANHGAHTVSIFGRSAAASDPIQYGPEPVTVINDPELRCPHSVAFTPTTHHLVVTNAGANYFCVYGLLPDSARRGKWSQIPALRHIVGPQSVFREVNARNKLEGGPKGVAVHGNMLAICSPEHGIKIYSVSPG